MILLLLLELGSELYPLLLLWMEVVKSSRQHQRICACSGHKSEQTLQRVWSHSCFFSPLLPVQPTKVHLCVQFGARWVCVWLEQLKPLHLFSPHADVAQCCCNWGNDATKKHWNQSWTQQLEHHWATSWRVSEAASARVGVLLDLYCFVWCTRTYCISLICIS